MKGKLSIPQRTVLLWDEIHPYNAVHVVRVPEPLEPGRLEDTVERCLEMKGLTGLEVDRRRKRYRFKGGPADVRIRVIDEPVDNIQALTNEIRKQLNLRFEGDTRVDPFRFFVVSNDKSFYLGIVYFHLVSGGDSIIYLLRNIVDLYSQRDISVPVRPLRFYQNDRTYRKLLGPKQFFRWIRNIPAHIAKVRGSFRPHYSDVDDHTAGFTFFSLGPPHLHSLITGARRWGVTVNDIFLAVLLLSVSRFSGGRVSQPRRKLLSLASVVNIRKDLCKDDPESFGFFLGNFVVSHAVPDGIQLEELVKDIHLQTDKIKKDKFYLGTIIDQWLALLLVPRFFKKSRNRFYSKNYPLWGGISNINLNTIWERSEDEARIDYFRAVSTGPVTPLVFSLTSVNDILNVGVSFRTTVFSESDIDRMVSLFSEYVSKIEVNHDNEIS